MGRGSARALYTIANVLEVRQGDIGKDIQMVLDQKLLFKFENNEKEPGQWELVDYEKRTLLLLSETPRMESGFWGVLLQARALGSGKVVLRFTPGEDGKQAEEVPFSILIRR